MLFKAHIGTNIVYFKEKCYFCKDMLMDILKAFLIGICASIPLGPIAIFVIHKSLSKGHFAGFLTGLGATLVDTVFSIIAIFAFAIAENFLAKNEIVILIVGGIIVVGLGAVMTFKDPFRNLQKESAHTYTLKDFVQSVAMGLSNPGAILVIFTLFAIFNVEVARNDFTVLPILLAIAAGSVVYWFFYSMLFASLRRSFKMITLIWINRISGIIVILIGLSLFADGMIKWLLR